MPKKSFAFDSIFDLESSTAYSLTIHEPSFLNSKTLNPISELFIHKLWEYGALANSALISLSGDLIEVVSSGIINDTNGPDVLHATIKCKGLIYHGSIEFHISEQDWFEHNHQSDKNYENVIAHIFLEKGKKRAFSGVHEPIFHIELTERNLSKTVISKLISTSKSAIPCGNVAIKAQAEHWTIQLELAQRTYFNELKKRFIFDIDSEDSFKKRLCLHIWDQLGVPHNREIMKELFERWFEAKQENDSAFNIPNKMVGNSKSVRPNQRLNKITKIAEALSNGILLSELNKKSIAAALQNFLNDLAKKIEYSISRQTVNRLNKFVWLPAIHAYSDKNVQLEQEIYAKWSSLSTPISKNERRYFAGIEFFENILSKNNHPWAAAMVAQQRFYCKPKRCNECYLFKIHFRY
jgi:hypothetical protein